MGCVLGAPNPGWSWGLKPEAATGPPQPSWREGSLLVRAQIWAFPRNKTDFPACNLLVFGHLQNTEGAVWVTPSSFWGAGLGSC